MKTRIFFLSLLTLVGFNSCTEEFVDIQPLSFVTVENYYKTPEEAETALNGVYNILSAGDVQGFGNQSTYSRQLMIMLNGGTDEAIVPNTFINPNYVEFGTANFTPLSLFINESWVFFYSGINRANVLLDRIDQIEGFEGNRKNEIIAEARVLRGYYHMILSMMHGGIPVYDDVGQNPEKPRNNIQEVYSLILADFEFGYQTLQDRAPVQGRANKWTAAGLLAKAHTYLASAKNNGLQAFIDVNSFDWVDVNEHYQKALGYTQEIIGGSGYFLTENYDYLFRENTKAQQYEEVLLAAEASSDPSNRVSNIIVNAFVPQGNFNLRGGGFGWFRPTSELYNKYIEGDLRRDHNITGNMVTDDDEFIEGVRYFVPRPLPNMQVGFACIGKYRMIDPALKSLPNFASNINLPLVRYADILLLHAESQYFLGNESGARATLSLVRARAVTENISLEELNANYQRANFVDELLDERSRELCFESWRRIDLARFNRFDQVINSLSTTDGFYNSNTVEPLQSNWKPERVWFPIPTIQLDLNSNLIQNSGY
jgi:hypothetical protein